MYIYIIYMYMKPVRGPRTMFFVKDCCGIHNGKSRKVGWRRAILEFRLWAAGLGKSRRI